jgi:c-di-GMP-binding flagellar brake protein YcgR
MPIAINGIYMNRRAFERIDTSLPVKYFCEESLLSGTVKNLSENGMFISTGNFLPCSDRLEIIVPLEDEISKFYARIRRIEKVDDLNYSMGIELIDPPDNYRKFVDNLKISVQI